MDWLNRFNSAIDYVENNLDNEIDYSHVAKIACCSEFHFSRMFSSLANVSLSEYVRRRRLTLAAFEIQKSDVKIIDVSIKYGYSSPDAFTRAFRQLHGVTPVAVRKNSAQLKAYARMSFQITIKGASEMDYRIENIDCSLRCAVKRETVKTADAFKTIPQLWANAQSSGLLQKLIDMSWENPKCQLEGLLGIFGNEASLKDETFDLLMGCRYDCDIPNGMEELILPPCAYAVFPNNNVSAWKRLYTEWLPTSGYELANHPCIENYLAPGAEIEQELWVPIIAK
ncbi:AraC family transcriptional regulator [Desulfosporosinus sp. PR]|uniref:AraC family transcriptional regulator n=1 Tax=Candidatus Desulfosporosinus nitrosoreducens TaxID=3401928 RepID=UPI0027F71329|nr:AraC family transcriptional regulator [Desulfosporosinus sp. PR]MDQ7095031.1 AraC family transcriptional regulator [Desulfosporosinus sp. PR]